jgi:uncharacterized NAD-dependent epimerase/dehydratase family protein
MTFAGGASGRRLPFRPLEFPAPYLLFLGDVTEPDYAKTAFGLRDWAAERCIGEMACGPGAVTVGLPTLTAAEARAKGARSVVIGVANVGGELKASWIPPLVTALEAGLDLVSGMHTRLQATPALAEAARRCGRRLVDVRVPPSDIPVASGRKRSGRRLLTVGTDCALGKKYTALALARAARERGLDADFRATGQTGILIAGSGMPMDAVVADFAAGAAEMLTPDAAPDHWDVIEGQCSLSHPAYAPVSLALLHGSQPDVIVVCHKPDRKHMVGHESFELPGIQETIDLNLRLGRRTNPEIRCGGISLNTSQFPEAKARRTIERIAKETGLPVADPMRSGLADLADACFR